MRAAFETPWAILPAKLAVIQDLLAFRAAGGVLTPEEVQERIGPRRMDLLHVLKPLSDDEAKALKAQWEEAQKGGRTIVVLDEGLSAISARETVIYEADYKPAAAGGRSGGGAVAVVPLVGSIIPRADGLAESSGAISVQRFRGALRRAMADPEIGSVVLDVDSPGGAVSDVPEMADEIYQARGAKPIVAVANTLAASAAYWIASAAEELVVSPSGEVGSIGVFAMHQDMSAQLAQKGVTVSLISAGKHKVEGNPFEPLGEEARAAIQERVDDYYGMFVSAVARQRGVSRADVLSGFGEGRVVGAREAVRLGMADRVATLDETVQRLAGARRRAPATGASAGLPLSARRRRLRLHGSVEPENNE
jgi:signal peptide peptidase SppA